MSRFKTLSGINHPGMLGDVGALPAESFAGASAGASRETETPRHAETTPHEERRAETPPREETPRRARFAGRLAAALGLTAALDLEEVARQEELRLARRLFLKDGARRRTVVFAGAERESGFSEVCLRTARTVASLTPRQVCVVDADVLSPEARHNGGGACSDNGVGAAIDWSVPTPMDARRLSPDNLWMVHAGADGTAPSDLLSPEKVKPHIEQLGARFDCILISAPPVCDGDEALALGRLADGLVLVVTANRTRRRSVASAVGRLEALEIPLLGIVMTGRTFPIPEPLYRLL